MHRSRTSNDVASHSLEVDRRFLRTITQLNQRRRKLSRLLQCYVQRIGPYLGDPYLPSRDNGSSGLWIYWNTLSSPYLNLVVVDQLLCESLTNLIVCELQILLLGSMGRPTNDVWLSESIQILYLDVHRNLSLLLLNSIITSSFKPPCRTMAS